MSSAVSVSSRSWLKPSVSTIPGEISVVRTPVPLKSCRAASAMPVTANFVAE